MSNYLNTTHRNVLWFKRAFGLGELQMAPPFQRKPVWIAPQKSYLIDTILKGYPIPEIYMQDLIGPDAGQTHIVVDGQQRIRTCLEFIEGLCGPRIRRPPRRREEEDLRIPVCSQASSRCTRSGHPRYLPAAQQEQLRPQRARAPAGDILGTVHPDDEQAVRQGILD